MKKFKILPELPKCDTGTRSEQMLLDNGANRLAPRRAATHLQFVKNIISARHNKTKYTCNYLTQISTTR